MSKFIFDSKNIIKYNELDNSLSNELDNDIFKKTSIFSLDNDCLKSLKNNHREMYKNIAERYIEDKKIFDIEKYNNDYMIIYKSFVNNNGVIVTNDKEIFVNGGCLCGDIKYVCYKNTKKIDNVISITSLWSSGIWHFPFEAFVSLMSIPKDILNKSKIHVSSKTNYIIQWFNLLNIPHSQLITGDIYADTLYVPRMGKCGCPYYSQVKWLKNIVNNNILNSQYEYVILIKRNNRRKLQNYNELEILLKKYCKRINLNLYIHDDSKLLSLVEQQQIFSKAKIVVAPHGAGGINIIAMKESSWYIEFLSVEDINICYSRLAYLCNINYRGLSMFNLTVDLRKVITILVELL